MCVCVYVCVYVCVCVFVCVCVHMGVCATHSVVDQLGVSVYLPPLCAVLWGDAGVHVCVCAYVCMCVLICVNERVCLGGSEWERV